MVKRSRQDSVSSSPEAADSPFIASDSASPVSSGEPSRSAKYTQLDAETKPVVMRCLLPPHQPLTFASYEEYNVHYQKSHVNRCAECHKNFPSDHYLGLHIAENHDSLAEARRARGEKTVCLVSLSPSPMYTRSADSPPPVRLLRRNLRPRLQHAPKAAHAHDRQAPVPEILRLLHRQRRHRQAQHHAPARPRPPTAEFCGADGKTAKY